jgi:hypothetical protein
MRAPIVLLASAALVMPTAAVASPVHAATATPTVLNCHKTKHGVTVRVRLTSHQDKGFTQVRVSHHRGTGIFHNPHVRTTSVAWGQIGTAVSRPRGSSTIRAAASSYANPVRDRPTFRVPVVGNGFSVDAKFTLRNGTHIHVFCGFLD